MKFFRFEKPFDFKPSAAVTMHFATGSTRKVTEAIVEAATAAGAGAIDEKATEEVHVDDTPQLASVIRGPETSAPPPKPVERPTGEKVGKAKG